MVLCDLSEQTPVLFNNLIPRIELLHVLLSIASQRLSKMWILEQQFQAGLELWIVVVVQSRIAAPAVTS